MSNIISPAKLARAATITITIERDPEPVRGNLLASGDDSLDRKYEDQVIARLDAGDDWAWCVVTVTASYAGVGAGDSLGACSYASEKMFRRDAYFRDMRDSALSELRVKLMDQIEDTEREIGEGREVSLPASIQRILYTTR